MTGGGQFAATSPSGQGLVIIIGTLEFSIELFNFFAFFELFNILASSR